MKTTIFVLGLVLVGGLFVSPVSAAVAPCTLTVSPQYAPLGTSQIVTVTLSGNGMSGSFQVPLVVSYRNTYSFTMPYQTGSCSASVFGTSTRQPI